MSPEVMGVEMDADVRGWGNAQRRVGSLLTLVVAAVLLAGALAAYFLLGSGGAPVYWTLVALVALALVFELLLLVLRPRSGGAAWAPQQEAEAQPEPRASAQAEPAWSPPPATTPMPQPVRTLTLRCSDCGTVFEVADTGERPLRHVCPGCGAEGTLRDEAMAPAPALEPEPASPPQPAPVAIRRLKLRCGGCKEVFTIEDTGERPLRRPCPYCGRTGEVR